MVFFSAFFFRGRVALMFDALEEVKLKLRACFFDALGSLSLEKEFGILFGNFGSWVVICVIGSWDFFFFFFFWCSFSVCEIDFSDGSLKVFEEVHFCVRKKMYMTFLVF
jgi:hypothetical protein